MKQQIHLRASTPVPFTRIARAFDRRLDDGHLLPKAFAVRLTDGTTVARRVAVTATNTRRNADGLICDVTVRDERRPRGFPQMTGTLFIRSHRSGDTVIWLLGEYQHPLGPLGAVGSAVGGDRLARESLESMFATLVESLVAEATGSHVWLPAAPSDPLLNQSALA